MKVSINLSGVIFALAAMAVVSVLVMVVLIQIDHIVHGVLYNFGLTFSYRWATPYWVSSGLIVGLSWFNIVADIALIYYVFKRRKKPSKGLKAAGKGAVEEPEDGKRLEPGGYGEPQKLEAFECAEAPVQTAEEASGERPADTLVEMQIGELSYAIKRYDVRHPKDVVDSQC